MKIVLTKNEFNKAIARWGQSDAYWIKINDPDGKEYKYKNAENFMKEFFMFLNLRDWNGSFYDIINFSYKQIFIEENNQTINVIDYIEKNHIHLMKIYKGVKNECNCLG